MKLATWNVNSLKVRLPHVLDWLAGQQPDVLCLQEIKLEDGAFPEAEIAQAGYHSLWAGQKTYNGVAILSRVPAVPVARSIPGFDDEQKRLLAADVDGVRVVCAYFPNGQAVGSDKYAYKLRWIEALTRWLGEELPRSPHVALAGDFNVAPEDRDVYDPQAWEGQVLCSAAERAAFRGLTELGLTDAFRLFDQPEKSFSWWDYRQAAFRRDMGLRIDHILLSSALARHCTACSIDRAPRKLERPSDHAPVIAEFGTAP
jgi:exodeoxyribonuclease-3